MKNYLFLLFLLGLVGCAASIDESSTIDSTYTHVTTLFEESDTTILTSSDVPEISMAVKKLISARTKKSNRTYTLRLSASGYEYQTTEVWTFDSLLNLVHCYQDWSSEGVEGTTHNIFQRERLYAIEDRNAYQGGIERSVYHREMGGFSVSLPGSSHNDSITAPLDKNYFLQNERDLQGRLSQIVNLLRRNKERVSGSEPAELRVVNESDDEEMPGKETTEITIDRKLLSTLVN